MEADKYGFCVFCHANLLQPRVVGGKEIMMFTPDFDQTEFVISNNSRMVVCMCKPCKASVNLSDPSVHEQIMESVIAGWDLETASQPTPKVDSQPVVSDVQESTMAPMMAKMSEQEVQDVRAPSDYHDLSILFHSEGIDDYVVQNRLAKLGQ